MKTLMLLLPTCLAACHANSDTNARYQSLDKSTVLIVQDGYSYMGTPNFPPSSNPVMTYGAKIVKYDDGIGCTSYAGLLVPHRIVDGGYCHGEQLKTRHVRNNSLTFSMICWNFSDGKCFADYSVKRPAREIIYEVMEGEVRRIIFSATGENSPGGSLLYVAGAPIRIAAR
jgi:hypothetical protein